MPTAFDEITGEMVDTSSEAWRHRCECSWLLANKPTRADKHLYLYGVADRSHLFEFNTKTGRDELRPEFTVKSHLKMSILKMRSLEAADRLLADAKKLHEARQRDAE